MGSAGLSECLKLTDHRPGKTLICHITAKEPETDQNSRPQATQPTITIMTDTAHA